MFSITSNHLPLALRSPRLLLTAGIGVAAALGVASYVLTRRKPTAEELERERREQLARMGRITDGTILETLMTEPVPVAAEFSLADPTPPAVDEDSLSAPHIIVYNYRIAGVSYECSQDVTDLADYVLGVRTDLPIQVRYEPHNPGNSIVVAESWSGLRLLSTHPSHPDTLQQ